MKKILPLACALALSLGLTAARAATLAQDTQELRFNGIIDPTTLSGDEFGLHLSYGYFFADNIQAGGRIGLLDNDLVTTMDLGAYVEYNVDTGSEIMPFGELFAGLANVDIEGSGGDNTAGLMELRAGAKLFLAEHVALAAAGVFAYATENIYPDSNKLRDNDVFLEFSLRCYF
ncbi:MAG: hypothetical protein H3C50_10585 [Kiritimatiellae bacterium]|nr:hypothetical protein [Kiritimatiellia bacterium]MCO5067820.1 hypothetical protein [Kiritimatiellia bacterium]